MQYFSILDALNAMDELDNKQPTEINPGINSELPAKLIQLIKCATIDFKTLHRNLSGGNWYEIHELLGDYYKQMDEFEDAIVENLISLGIKDVKVNADNLIEPKSFEEQEALSIAKEKLNAIKETSMELRKAIQLPSSIAPAFDELENWIQIESDYKLKHYFKENN